MATRKTPIASVLASYAKNTRVRATLALITAQSLVAAAPSDSSALERRRLQELLARAEEVDAILRDTARKPPARLRSAREKLTNAWSALFEALSAGARIPRSVSDRGARCQALLGSLFGNGGLRFTQLGAGSAWSHSNRTLERIEEEGLAGEITALVGADFLATLHEAMSSLTAALDPAAPRRATPLALAVRDFQRAVGAYTRALVAAVDIRDLQSVERFHRAVAPLEQFGSSRARRSDERDEPNGEIDRDR